jgi:hypothetical protein
MNAPKFISISLDEVNQRGVIAKEELLPKHYIGLLTELPTLEHPYGVELSGAGYQRQFYEPMSPKGKVEWVATQDWPKVVGFIVYDKFAGQSEALMWAAFYSPLSIYKGETAMVRFSDLVQAVDDAYSGKYPRSSAAVTREPTYR